MRMTILRLHKVKRAHLLLDWLRKHKYLSMLCFPRFFQQLLFLQNILFEVSLIVVKLGFVLCAIFHSNSIRVLLTVGSAEFIFGSRQCSSDT